MPPRLGILFACLALGASLPAHALDLQQAFQLSLERDASLRAAQALTAAGREKLPQARAQLLPNLSLSVGAHANTLDSWQGSTRTARDFEYPSDNTTLTLRQPLYRPYLWATYRQARAQVDDAEERLRHTTGHLSVRVSEAYFNALLAEDQHALLRAQMDNYRVQLEASRKALDAGSATRTDVDEAQARLDLTSAAELQARQQVDYARQALQALIDQPVTRLQGLEPSRLELREPQPASVAAWVDMAEGHSAELRALQAQLSAAREQVTRAAAGHLPTLDLMGQWQRSKSENVLEVRSRYERATLGLMLNVPLFSGGFVQSAVREALAEQERLQASLEALRRDLALRIHKEHRGMTEGVARVRALAQALRSSEQLLISNRRSFQAGSRTLVDVFNAEQQRMAALKDLAQARYDYLLSRIRLQALAGGDTHALVRELNSYLQP